MKLDMITDGLRQLLIENNYNPRTIAFYECEWKKIRKYLIDETGDTEFEMELGLKYLEKKYGIISNCKNGTLSQQRVQLLRVVHMLEDYSLHRVLTCRYHASKNPISLNDYYGTVHSEFSKFLDGTELSKSTKSHYTKMTLVFLDYLSQLKINTIEQITLKDCHGYLNTLSGFSYKTVEQKVCGLRFFLKYLFSVRKISKDYAKDIHMPAISKTAKIPSTWSVEELKTMIAAIDRNSPVGKRDYAMILLACILGLRIGDIKLLKFNNFNWEKKQLSIIQHKTNKPLTLPVPDAVGWAIIDYIRNGRPAYYDTDIVFLKHMPPFDPIADSDHMHQLIIRYMRKAGINRIGRKRSGFHSLRHSAGSMLLEMDTPLPVITNILGHSDPDITAVYLKTDILKLAECVLPVEDFNYV